MLFCASRPLCVSAGETPAATAGAAIPSFKGALGAHTLRREELARLCSAVRREQVESGGDSLQRGNTVVDVVGQRDIE